jgi:hypothetical protein
VLNEAWWGLFWSETETPFGDGKLSRAEAEWPIGERRRELGKARWHRANVC